MIGDSSDDTNLPNILSLTDKLVLRFCKSFANNSLANIKLSKNQLATMMQLAGDLARLFQPLLKTCLSLMIVTGFPLAEGILISLGLIVAALSVDTGIHKKYLGSGVSTLTIPYKEMNDILEKRSKGMKDNIPGRGVLRASEGVIKTSKG